jgi:hypothetical protein
VLQHTGALRGTFARTCASSFPQLPPQVFAELRENEVAGAQFVTLNQDDLEVLSVPPSLCQAILDLLEVRQARWTNEHEQVDMTNVQEETKLANSRQAVPTPQCEMTTSGGGQTRSEANRMIEPAKPVPGLQEDMDPSALACGLVRCTCALQRCC